MYELGTDNCLSHIGSNREPSLLRIDDRLVPGWDASPESKAVVSGFWRQSYNRIQKKAKDVGDEQLFEDFFLSMVALDPDNRLSAEALLDHPYLSDVPFCRDIGKQTGVFEGGYGLHG